MQKKPIWHHHLILRNVVLGGCLLLLAGCHSFQFGGRGFTKEQIETMEREGFEEEGPNYELGLEDRMLFDVGKSVLKPEMQLRLAKLSDTLVNVKIGGALIEGHTDSTGSAEFNMKLSNDRAIEVKKALVAGGMAQAAVTTWGRGESDPVATNETEDGRAENRRVVVVVGPADIIH